jgi:hypothetical protein
MRKHIKPQDLPVTRLPRFAKYINTKAHRKITLKFAEIYKQEILKVIKENNIITLPQFESYEHLENYDVFHNAFQNAIKEFPEIVDYMGIDNKYWWFYALASDVVKYNFCRRYKNNKLDAILLYIERFLVNHIGFPRSCPQYMNHFVIHESYYKDQFYANLGYIKNNFVRYKTLLWFLFFFRKEVCDYQNGKLIKAPWSFKEKIEQFNHVIKDKP